MSHLEQKPDSVEEITPEQLEELLTSLLNAQFLHPLWLKNELVQLHTNCNIQLEKQSHNLEVVAKIKEINQTAFEAIVAIRPLFVCCEIVDSDTAQMLNTCMHVVNIGLKGNSAELLEVWSTYLIAVLLKTYGIKSTSDTLVRNIVSHFQLVEVTQHTRSLLRAAKLIE